MENKFIIGKVRKSGKGKIVTVPLKANIQIDDYVRITPLFDYLKDNLEVKA